MNSYEETLGRHLDALSSGISNSLSEVNGLSPEVAHKVLGEILGYACQATHGTAILAGRKAFAALPQQWLDEHLDAGITAHLNLQDYWEYGRLMELLTAAYPPLLPKYLQLGLTSGNPVLREIAEDHSRDG